MHIHYVMISMGEESEPGLAESSIQRFTRLHSKCHLAHFSSESLTHDRPVFGLTQVVGRIYFLVTLRPRV